MPFTLVFRLDGGLFPTGMEKQYVVRISAMFTYCPELCGTVYRDGCACVHRKCGIGDGLSWPQPARAASLRLFSYVPADERILQGRI